MRYLQSVAQLSACDQVPAWEPRKSYAHDCSTVAHEAFSHPRHLSRHCRATRLLRLPRNAGRALIWIYRHTLSPLVGYNCRHLPTCSVYGDEAIERFGLWGGGWMTLARLLRCQPWGTSGIDNVPLTRPAGCAMVSAVALRALARRQRALTKSRCSAAPLQTIAHCCRARNSGLAASRIGLMLLAGGNNNALENQPPRSRSPADRSARDRRAAHPHRRRLAAISTAASPRREHAGFIVPSQSVRW